MNAKKVKPTPTENILVLFSYMADLPIEYWIVPQKYNILNVARAISVTYIARFDVRSFGPSF